MRFSKSAINETENEISEMRFSSQIKIEILKMRFFDFKFEIFGFKFEIFEKHESKIEIFEKYFGILSGWSSDWPFELELNCN